MKTTRCTKCVMDTTDPDIFFDESGVCNHCHRYESDYSVRTDNSQDKEGFVKLISNIKRSRSKTTKYDCVIGVSGGVDSTYVAYLLKEQGLNPLAIHFDNGWNSELAVKNIENCLKTLDIDLYTYVIEWSSFREIQKAFLQSGTPDGEIPTDHAINALLFKEAKRRGIKYIINGMNFKTESLKVENWAYGHSDFKYIRDVLKKNGNIGVKGYPKYTLLDLFLYVVVYRIKVVSVLNYVDYNREEVMDILQSKLGWQNYGGKHYESIYTRFYQGYVLPEKFNIDKRIGHLSDLIRSGSISRERAIEALSSPPLAEDMIQNDLKYVLKKFQITHFEFESYFKKVDRFKHYRSNRRIIGFMKMILNFLRKIGILSK